MTADTAAPPEVALLRDFVNTREPQVGQDVLASPAALSDWLSARGLLPPGSALSPADLAAAVTVREGLRSVLLAHAGHDADTAAVAALNRVLADLPARVVFAQDGTYRLAGSDEAPLGAALGALADAVRQASEDGTWRRLKTCARDSCRWAFYDASRNQVRRWCSMAGCGTHTKNQRAYAARTDRARRQAAGEQP